MANIDPEKIEGATNQLDAAKLIDWNRVDIAYVLYGTKNINEADDVKEYLIKRAKEEA
jgi:hypothetical protein